MTGPSFSVARSESSPKGNLGATGSVRGTRAPQAKAIAPEFPASNPRPRKSVRAHGVFR
ncbi:hypothetical protein SAMN05444166_6808 [Singulisphaera sp. GP187]|nr:hypothetical protein SAMN05444166_6808 [Singulisphaera sp. GP187]